MSIMKVKMGKIQITILIGIYVNGSRIIVFHILEK